MANNLIHLKGNLGDDPEIFRTKEGKEIATMLLAVSEQYYDQQTKEYKYAAAQWFNCIIFGAMIIDEARHLKKGSFVNASGKIRIKEYEDKQGRRNSSVEVIVTSLEEIVLRKKPTDV